MRSRHWWGATCLVVGVLAAAACQPVTSPPPATPSCTAAPGSTIPGQWVATVDPDGPEPTEVVTFAANTQAEKDAEVADLEADGTVLTVEPDRVVAALDTVTPGDDPHYSSVAPLQEAALVEGGFPGAWTAGFGGSGTTIAILDSGVNAGHEDLQGRVLQGADFVGSQTNLAGSTNYARTDPYGHGTHVAGIAGASDNTVGGIGAAPLASILPVRVLNSCGTGSFGDVAEGIQWAADQGVDIISMSLGGSGSCSGAIDTAVAAARDAGALVVAAAGNSSSGALGVPAKCVGVLAVGASDGSGTAAVRASFSNYGNDVDIAAPGVGIYSTYVPNGPSYTTLSGTSMATPFVSAAAALVHQHCLSQLPPPGAARGDRIAQILLASRGPLVPSLLAHSLRISATAGTYTLTYEGSETTAPLAFDATASQVAQALEALPGIGAGNVVVTAVAPGSGESARFAIVLSGSAASNDAFTYDTSALSGSIVTVTPPPFPGRLDAAAAVAASCT